MESRQEMPALSAAKKIPKNQKIEGKFLPDEAADPAKSSAVFTLHHPLSAWLALIPSAHGIIFS